MHETTAPRTLTAGQRIELARRLTGSVVGPNDPGWDHARQAWNLYVEQRPAAVVHVADVADVVTVTEFAREHGFPVAAQPTGHGARHAVDGALLVRTNAFRSIEVDLTHRRARVGAGVRWQQLNEVLSDTRLTALPGSSGDTSVTGLTLGGGVSWFGRRHGLPANHVRYVDLVTPDAVHIRVTRDSDPDLFWAVRGAAGEFGVVTAIEFELFALPDLWGGRMMWPLPAAPDILSAFAEVAPQAPESLTPWAWILCLPHVPAVPAAMRGQWVVAVDVVSMTGEDDSGTVDALRRVGPPLADTTAPLALDRLADVAADPVDPTPVLADGALLTGLDSLAVKSLLAVPEVANPSMPGLIQLRRLGGAFAHESADNGAAGHIPEPYLLVAGGPALPEWEATLRARLRDVRTALEGYDSGRVPANFNDGGHPLEAMYDPQTLARLRALKVRFDPENTMRGNRSLLE